MTTKKPTRIDPLVKKISARITPENIREVAHAAMMSQAQVRNILDGTNDPRLSTVRRLAQAAGVAVTALEVGNGE